MNRTRSYCHECKKSRPRLALLTFEDGREICASCLGVTDVEIPEVELHRMRASLTYSTNREGKELPMHNGVNACDFCCLAELEKNLLHVPWLVDGVMQDVHLCRDCAEKHCVVLRDHERTLFQRIALALAGVRSVRDGSH